MDGQLITETTETTIGGYMVDKTTFHNNLKRKEFNEALINVLSPAHSFIKFNTEDATIAEMLLLRDDGTEYNAVFVAPNGSEDKYDALFTINEAGRILNVIPSKDDAELVRYRVLNFYQLQ